MEKCSIMFALLVCQDANVMFNKLMCHCLIRDAHNVCLPIMFGNNLELLLPFLTTSCV